jgi:23S rRNA pseudouridine2605 synthase
LNKPKDFVTTMDDPQGRKTVMQLIKRACRERVYPVGRLDRNSTGVLLFTNDGEMTTKLTHPKFGVRKMYHVELDRPVEQAHLDALVSGVEIDDGSIVNADVAEFVKDKKNREIGMELHSGKNRVVRRMFEALGYEVKKLDRVAFAGLTKKDLSRGNWRFLTEAEVGFLQML